MAGILESLGTFLSPLGTNVGLKTMIERCLAARTKSEERWLVHDSLELVKLKLSEPSTRSPVIAKCLLFASLAEMLGYKADFACIHALKLAQQGLLNEKKIGYLACSALLRPSDSLSILLVNTILRDLASRNIFEIAMAITASCQFFPDDQLPTLLPLLAEKLRHANEYVRCKAVIALHHFSLRSLHHCSNYFSNVVALLSDKHPGVVAHVIHFLADNQSIMQSDEFTLAVVNVQRQILSGKLPRDYNYHGLSAPWMQVSLIRLLGSTSSAASVSVVQDTLSACTDLGQLMVCAIACECVAALVRLNPSQDSTTQALRLALKLLADNNANLRLAGLQLLERLSPMIDTSLLAILHRPDSILLTTLQHCDRTLRNATLRLLCATSTHASARSICSLVADAVDQSRERADHSQIATDMELVRLAVDLASKFPDDRSYWHLAMMIRLLPMISDDSVGDVQARIKAALTENESEHLLAAQGKVLRVLREYCARKQASTRLLQMYVWALSRCSRTEEAVAIITQIGLKVVRHSKQGSSALLVSIVDAATHSVTRANHSPDLTGPVLELTRELLQSRICVGYLRDATLELRNTCINLSQVQQVLKAAVQENFDFTLSFLDDYVVQSLESGGGVYKPLSQSQSATTPDFAGSESGSRSWAESDILSSLDSWNPFHSPRSTLWTPTGRVEVEATSDEATFEEATGDANLPWQTLDSEIDDFDQLATSIAQGKS